MIDRKGTPTLQAMLANALANSQWVQADSIKVIEKTAVPVINLTTQPLSTSSLGVKLDVTFEGPEHRGVASTQLVQDLICEFPPLKSIVLILRTLLFEKRLDNAYTGGVTCFGLVLLVARYLQHVNQKSLTDDPMHPPSPSCGALLSGFLSFFGSNFDPHTQGISIDAGAHSRSGKPSRQYAGRFLSREHNKGSSSAGSSMGGQVRSSSTLGDNRRKSIEDTPTADLNAANGAAEVGAGVGVGGGGQDRHKFQLDPLYIEHPLAPATNVTRNSFRCVQGLGSRV